MVEKNKNFNDDNNNKNNKLVRFYNLFGCNLRDFFYPSKKRI